MHALLVRVQTIQLGQPIIDCDHSILNAQLPMFVQATSAIYIIF